MPTKKTPTSPKRTTTARKDTTATSPRTPVKMLRSQVAPHVKTLNNGQPRPKSRRSK